MTYGLDTSVVVRLLMCEPPELAVKARDFVEAALDAGHLFYISDLAISETYFVLQHHYGKTMTAIHGAARNRAKTPRAGAFEGLRASDIGLRKSSVVQTFT